LQQQNGRPLPSPLHLSTFQVPLKQTDKVEQDPNRGMERHESLEAVGTSVIRVPELAGD
jgi:hypothetical protein